MDLIKQKRVFDYVGYVCSKILLDDLNNCTFFLTVLKQFDKLVTNVLSVTNKDLQLKANETTFEQRKSHDFIHLMRPYTLSRDVQCKCGNKHT